MKNITENDIEYYLGTFVRYVGKKDFYLTIGQVYECIEQPKGRWVIIVDNETSLVLQFGIWHPDFKIIGRD